MFVFSSLIIRAKKELDENLIVTQNWNELCSQLDHKKVGLFDNSSGKDSEQLHNNPLPSKNRQASKRLAVFLSVTLNESTCHSCQRFNTSS